jgi:phosphohistidine swiveling domain-containing protein
MGCREYDMTDAHYPETLSDIETELKMYLRTEPRQDALMRQAIFVSQIGPLVSHMTHDPKENPEARPYGTPAGEKADFGAVLLNAMIYGISRGLPVQESVNAAFVSLRERDWKARQQTFDSNCHGQLIWPGIVEGRAYVDLFAGNLKDMPEGCILVVSHADASISQYIDKCAAIVADHGGMGCHIATVARERGKPCVVGTGKATFMFKTGDFLHFHGIEGKEKGNVFLVMGE